MKNRFSRMGNALLGAMCLLTTCGLSYSCSDDYDLDDTNPSFLGGSIYDELKSRGNFETTIKLIDDLDYADVMSKTGSKTLFVANDDAYANFFQTTTWTDGQGQPVRSYNQLSTNQKRLLLFNSMLNNAYVMEMMANTSGGGTNECLRQVTQAAATDSVGYWRWDQLPVNEYVATEGEDDYPDFWAIVSSRAVVSIWRSTLRSPCSLTSSKVRCAVRIFPMTTSPSFWDSPKGLGVTRTAAIFIMRR